MLVGLLTMFVRRHSVFHRLLVLAEIMMMSGLVMMVGGGMVMGGGLMMMLARRMLRLCRGVVPPNRSWKNIPAASIWGGFRSPQPCLRRAANCTSVDICTGASKKTLGFAWAPLGFPSPNRAFSRSYSDP